MKTDWYCSEWNKRTDSDLRVKIDGGLMYGSHVAFKVTVSHPHKG